MNDEYEWLRLIVAAVGTAVVAQLLRAGYQRWCGGGSKKARKP
jgi:hypothetical protein